MNHLLQNKYVRRLLVYPLLMVAAGYGWFQYKFPTCTFRYKLTAEVMTPDGPKTGSSVIEVSYSHYPGLGGPRTANVRTTGEAVYVDLGQGKNLFVTLRSHESGRSPNREREYALLADALDAYELPLKAFGLTWIFGEERALCATVDEIPENHSGVLPFEHYPTLVAFAKLDDPHSVYVVQPAKMAEEIGGMFEMIQLSIQITKTRPSESIGNVLPWLESKRPKDGAIHWRLSDPLIDRLHFTSFKQPL